MADCLLDLLTLKCYCLRMKYDALRANAEIFPRRLLGESAAATSPPRELAHAHLRQEVDASNI